MSIYLVKYDGESMEGAAFSSLDAAKEKMMAEWKAMSSDKDATDLYESDGRAMCKVHGQPFIWQIIPVEAGESALVEAGWPWQELIAYYGSKKEISDLMNDFYLSELDDLDDSDTGRDSRRESFNTGSDATVYHYGSSEPASCWTIL